MLNRRELAEGAVLVCDAIPSLAIRLIGRPHWRRVRAVMVGPYAYGETCKASVEDLVARWRLARPHELDDVRARIDEIDRSWDRVKRSPGARGGPSTKLVRQLARAVALSRT